MYLRAYATDDKIAEAKSRITDFMRPAETIAFFYSEGLQENAP